MKWWKNLNMGLWAVFPICVIVGTVIQTSLEILFHFQAKGDLAIYMLCGWILAEIHIMKKKK